MSGSSVRSDERCVNRSALEGAEYAHTAVQRQSKLKGLMKSPVSRRRLMWRVLVGLTSSGPRIG